MSNGTHSTLVSVMIPTYNQKQYLEAAIESVLAQTYPSLEIVVSDDASPDPGVTEVLDRYRALPNVTVYRNEKNLGRVANYRTTLYERTNGEWVVNLDGDDYFHDPTFIEKAMSLVAGHPGLVMVSCRCLEEAGAKRELIRNDTPPFLGRGHGPGAGLPGPGGRDLLLLPPDYNLPPRDRPGPRLLPLRHHGG